MDCAELVGHVSRCQSACVVVDLVDAQAQTTYVAADCVVVRSNAVSSRYCSKLKSGAWAVAVLVAG